MKVKIVIEETKTGYSAFAKKYPVVSTGRTLPKLLTNMVEAMNFLFSEMGEPLITIRELSYLEPKKK